MAFPAYVPPVVRDAIRSQCLRQIGFFPKITMPIEAGMDLLIDKDNHEFCKEAFRIFNRAATSQTYQYPFYSTSGLTSATLYIDCLDGGKVYWPDNPQRSPQDTKEFYDKVMEWMDWVDECIEKWALVRGLFDAFVLSDGDNHLKYAWPDFHLVFSRVTVTDGNRVTEWWHKVRQTTPGRFSPPVPEVMDHLEEARRTVLSISMAENIVQPNAPVRCRLDIQGLSFDRIMPWNNWASGMSVEPRRVDLTKI